MSDPVLKALEELKVGQNDIHDQLEDLQRAVSTLDRKITDHMTSTTDNFETITATLRAVHRKVSGDDSPRQQVAGGRG